MGLLVEWLKKKYNDLEKGNRGIYMVLCGDGARGGVDVSGHIRLMPLCGGGKTFCEVF